jgi:hypothetical protein
MAQSVRRLTTIVPASRIYGASYSLLRSPVKKKAMNNFATLISCTAEVLTPFFERGLTSITALLTIGRKFLSSDYKVSTFHLDQYIPLEKFTRPL